MFYSRWAHRMSQWVQQSVNRYYLMYVYVIIIRLPEYCINEAPGPLAQGWMCVTIIKSRDQHGAGGGARATGTGLEVCNCRQKQPPGYRFHAAGGGAMTTGTVLKVCNCRQKPPQEL